MVAVTSIATSNSLYLEKRSDNNETSSDEISNESFISESQVLNSTSYDFRISVQQLNSTNFRGVIRVATLTNNPISSNWALSFHSQGSLNITGVGRGSITYNPSAKLYSVTSVEAEEPDHSMAILVPFWGFYE